jgi:large subunit ribosomal protein L7/L12
MDETTNTVAPAVAEVKAEVKEVKVEAKPEAKAEEKTVATPSKFKAVVEAIEKMSVLDLHELVKHLEEKFGVSAQAVAVAAPVAGGAAAEEKSTFNVELTDGGATKIAVIKVVKEVLGLGLKEAKDLVDAAPSMLKEGMKKEDAEAVKKQIETAGGKVTLK